FTGSFTTSVDETLRADPCVAGPVRVVLARADGQVLSIDTYVGPPSVAEGVADLGRVPAREASAYLLDLARQAEGRPSREAILPAVLADSADPWPALLDLVRDTDRPLETRRSAIGWLSHGIGTARIDEPRARDALLALARDEGDRREVRTRALGALMRLEQGGVPALTTLVRQTDDPWLATQALTTLGASGDPRARRFLRETAQSSSLGPELQRLAVRGLGRTSYATGADVDALRALFDRTTTPEVREEIVRVVGAVGGRENTRWLLGVARREAEPSALRRAALRAAVRGDVEVGELVALYDASGERAMRQEIINLLARRTEPAATDKLIAIARSSDDRALQRAAISRLSRSDEPRVRAALEGIVGKP
ncbi:MAG TPA: HEAT repeat domain-containing protein, partial [Gemmatimonadaceae bacterium]|nr:HEAT repeat domain-containing protein [Gemmatimonadaceae bacterium]